MDKNQTISIRMSGSLFDETVDSWSEDILRMTGENLGRRSPVWMSTARGRGRVITGEISEPAARYLARYLRSRVGLHVAFDDDRKAVTRRSEEDGAAIAAGIEARISA